LLPKQVGLGLDLRKLNTRMSFQFAESTCGSQRRKRLLGPSRPTPRIAGDVLEMQQGRN
jgi:hypothetical protein